MQNSNQVCRIPLHWSFSMVMKEAAYIPAAFLGISPESYAILAVFMFADFFLGVLRTVLLHGPASFKSYKLISGLVSKLLVLCTPLLVVWAGEGADIPLLFIAQWSVGVLVLAQAYSILGHINAIRTGQDTTEWDGVAWVMGGLRSVLEALLTDGHSKEQ